MPSYTARSAPVIISNARRVLRRRRTVEASAPHIPDSTPASPIATPEDHGLATAAPEKLVAALDNPVTRAPAHAEIERRLESTPKANRCSLRFLLGWFRERSGHLTAQENADINADIADALEGLLKICFKAIGFLWLPGDQPSLAYVPTLDRDVRTDRALTRSFITERIWDFLLPFRDRSEQDLLLLALKREFSHLPNSVRCDLIDEIRKAYAKHPTSEGAVLRFVDLNQFEPTDPSTLHDSPDQHEPLELLNVEKSEFIEAIGPNNYETLMTLANFATHDDLPEDLHDLEPSDFRRHSRQARKSAATAAIADKLDIGPRQARTRKKDLREALHDAQRRGVPVVRTLYETLSVPQAPESVLTEQNDTEASDGTTSWAAVLQEILLTNIYREDA